MLYNWNIINNNYFNAVFASYTITDYEIIGLTVRCVNTDMEMDIKNR